MPRTRPTRTALLLALSLAGCGTAGSNAPPDGSATADDGSIEAPLFGGGTRAIESCGYAITTRDDAQIPQPGSPVLGSAPKPTHIHLGFTGAPSTTMAVLWRTADDTTLASTVQYGTGGVMDRTIEGYTFAYRSASRDDVRMHETHLCGLQPDTEYTYRVGGKDASGAESWSDAYTFRTAPDPTADTEVSIAIMGDTRGGMDIFAQALDQAQKLGQPDLVLFNGDAVLLGYAQKEWDEWFGRAEGLLRRVPIITAHGNHEVNSVNFFSQFALPGDEENFSFDYGPAHVTVLNDTPVMASAITGSTRAFLDADLKAATAPWKFALHHRTTFSSSNHGSDLGIRAAWQPLFDQYKVDFVFNGHDHDYERTKPMRGMTAGVLPTDGTYYVVTGSSGAPLYGNDRDFFTEVSEMAYSFGIVKIRRTTLEFRAYRNDGTLLDTVTIRK